LLTEKREREREREKGEVFFAIGKVCR